MEATDATVDIHATDTARRIVIDDELLAEVARTDNLLAVLQAADVS